MPQLDSGHPQVVSALEKAGWDVSDNPYSLDTTLNVLFGDIEAWRSDDNPIIVVEVKCFREGTSDMASLYNAIGQYLVYRNLLSGLRKNRVLYMALPSNIFQGMFQFFGMPLVNELRVNLIVVNLDKEEVEQWIEW
jgi:hypothetical protein